MNKLEKTIFSIGIFFFGIKSALAVPPPDFIFNVGAQVAQFFSIAVAPLIFWPVRALRAKIVPAPNIAKCGTLAKIN